MSQPSYTRLRKISSFRQIFDLKDGALLVMLQSKQNKINFLKAHDQDKEAQETYRNQLKKNRGIISAFRKNFKFCPVYFFSNADGEKLIQYGIDSIGFLNDSLVQDSSVKPGFQHFFVAELGIFSEHRHPHDSVIDQSARGKIPDYAAGSFTGLELLIIEDQQLNPLRKPFPFYESILEDDEHIFQIDEVVAELNRNLFLFYMTAARRIHKPKFSKYFEKN